MPTKPHIKTLVNSSQDILNAIRNNASINYQNYVPVATNDPECVREIGATIMSYVGLQNEFLSALVNRIGRVVLTSQTYQNPWAMFKRGFLEFGETIEEIFANIAKPFTFDPEVAEGEVFKREIPDVRSAYHVLNYQKFYKATVSQEQLRQAFLSYQGVTDLIAAIVDSMYTAANYDEFITMKYMLAKRILKGQMYPVTIPTVTAGNMKSIISTVNGVSNQMTFLSKNYNLAGVYKASAKQEQYILVDAQFAAAMDVEVLAAAFNMDKAEFMGHVVMVDGFGKLDTDRLNELFYGDATYDEISADELAALNAIPAVLVDGDWFMIFDNMMQFTENYNGQGLYWNYFYHVWKTFSVSPFANNALFVPGTPAVTSVTVSPSAADINAGNSLNLSALVATENFASQAVNWTSSNPGVTVDANGLVTVSIEASGKSATITATAVADSSKSATCTVTIIPVSFS